MLATAVSHLFDDAGLFPPARLPMAQGLVAHARATSGPHRALVGPFLCPVHRLAELDACVAAGGPRPVELGVIAYDAGRPGQRLALLPGLVQVEAPLGTPLPDFGGRVHRYVEIPRHAVVPTALDTVAASGARAKVRCGGPTREDVPSCERLADVLVGCVERGLKVKATAGLHQPFRATERAGPRHGFLNLLAAAAASLAGADRRAVAAILATEEADAESLLGGLPRGRALLASIGTCSIDEPVEALTERGLL